MMSCSYINLEFLGRIIYAQIMECLWIYNVKLNGIEFVTFEGFAYALALGKWVSKTE